ncbi:MAG TPA: thiamine pyrophosphate-binding protein [Actinomycetota bacterium]|nr:thiamine pyrophosphate-binding protein [Actinomycetota bacterium]
MRLTGGEVVAHALARHGVPYVVGIPGHGNWAVLDALRRVQPPIRFLQAMHEQSAVHVADGYYRATGRPLMATTSIGPGATNTVIGMATAYVDSSAVLLITGAPHTYMRGHSVLQELDRFHPADFPRVMEGVTKRHFEVVRVEELPFVLHRAFAAMLTGRPGPVHVDLPMDVQADAAEVEIPDPARRLAVGRTRPDPAEVQRAVRLLARAARPVVLAGGGVISADASAPLVALAERLGAAVVTTWNGKGAIPEDHPLNAWGVGDTASTCGNELARSADVLLAVGCRFVDWSSSSFRRGVTFSIPPTTLIQVDIDPLEIGKNYPAEVGLVADARAALEDLLAAIEDLVPVRDYRERPFFQDIQDAKRRWEELVAPLVRSDASPMSMQRVVHELRAVLDRSAIVTTGAGLPQAVVRQHFPVYEPRTHITSGGFSSMGFTVPAAIGAKLAHPDRQVVGIAGDGDFLQTMQEMAMAAIEDVAVVFLVMNNQGWISIRNGQRAFVSGEFGVYFDRRGEPYSANFAEVARRFGLHGERVERPDEVGPAVRRALASGGPAVVEAMIAREGPESGLVKTGWWDAPVPAYLDEQRARYEQARAEEQHLWG